MATNSRDVRDADKRQAEAARSASMKPDTQNDDGTVRDVAAQRFLAKQRAQAATAPADRIAEDQSVGTPAWLDENTADKFISDGGPTLVNKETLGKSVLEAAERDLTDDEKAAAETKRVSGKDNPNSANYKEKETTPVSPAVEKNDK